MTETVYVVLFRGINVGGNKVVKMETLRRVLGDAGFSKVATYIQSGNVVLTSQEGEDAVIDTVTRVFDETFGFSSRPTVRSAVQLQRVIDENPYKGVEGNRLHAVFLDGQPPAGAVQTLEALANTEHMVEKGGVLYLFTPDGLGISEVAKALDRTLKVPVTTRNWNTVLKLQAMCEVALG